MPVAMLLALLALLYFGRQGLMPAVTGNMRTSMAGRAQIIQHEGIRYAPYRDTAGYWTIGIGHKVIPGDGVPRGSDGVPLPIEETFLMTLFETDLNTVENTIRRYVRVPLTQGQFDAVADFVFQFGAGNFGTSTLLKFLNSGNYPGAAAEFKRWIYETDPETGLKRQNPGLITRREDNFRTFIA